MDVLAHSFIDYKEADILAWINDKDKLPTNTVNPYLTGQASFYGQFMLFLLELLVEEYPCELDDIDDIIEPFIKLLNTNFNQFLLINPVEEFLKHKVRDEGICFTVALAIGYYCSMIEADLVFLLSLTDKLCKALGVLDFQHELVECLAFTIWQLGNTGYFGLITMGEIEDYRLCPQELHTFFDMCNANPNSIEFLTQPYNAHNFGKISSLAKVVARAFYYMLRVDTAYRKDEFKSLPREQLPEVLTIDLQSISLPLVFGAICTMSESNHPLIPNFVRDNKLYKDRTSALFTYI